MTQAQQTLAPAAPEVSEAEKKCAAEDFALFSAMDALPLNNESEKNTLKTLRESVKEGKTGSELECHFVELPKDVEQKKILLQKSFEGTEKAELQKSLNTIFMGSAITLLEQFEACPEDRRKDFWTQAKQSPLTAMVSDKNIFEKAKDALFTAQMAMGANFEAGSIGEIVKNSWGDFVVEVEKAEKLGGEIAQKNEGYIPDSMEKFAATTGAGVAGMFAGMPLGPIGMIAGSSGASYAMSANYPEVKKSVKEMFRDGGKKIGEFATTTKESVKAGWEGLGKEGQTGAKITLGIAVGAGILKWFFSDENSSSATEKKSSGLWWKIPLGIGALAMAGTFGKDFLKGLIPEELKKAGEMVGSVVDGAKEKYEEGEKDFEEMKKVILEYLPDATPEVVKNFLEDRKFYEILIAGGITSAVLLRSLLKNPFKFSGKILGLFPKFLKFLPIAGVAFLAVSVFGIFSNTAQAEEFLGANNGKNEEDFIAKGTALLGTAGEKISETTTPFWEKAKEIFDTNAKPIIDSWALAVSYPNVSEKLSTEIIWKEIEQNRDFALLANTTSEKILQSSLLIATVLAILKIVKIVDGPIAKLLWSKAGLGVVGVSTLWALFEMNGQISEGMKKAFSEAVEKTQKACASITVEPELKAFVEKSGEEYYDMCVAFGFLGNVQEIPKNQKEGFLSATNAWKTEIEKISVETDPLKQKQKEKFLEIWAKLQKEILLQENNEKILFNAALLDDLCVLSESLGLKGATSFHQETQKYEISFGNFSLPPLSFNPYPSDMNEAKRMEIQNIHTTQFVENLQLLLGSETYAKTYPRSIAQLEKVKAVLQAKGVSSYEKGLEEETISLFQNEGLLVEKNEGAGIYEVSIAGKEKPYPFPISGFSAEKFAKELPYMESGGTFGNFGGDVMRQAVNDLEANVMLAMISEVLDSATPGSEIVLLAEQAQKELEYGQTEKMGELFVAMLSSPDYEISIQGGMWVVGKTIGKELQTIFSAPFTLFSNATNLLPGGEEMDWGKTVRESYILPIATVYIGGKILRKRSRIVTVPFTVIKNSPRIFYAAQSPVVWMKNKGFNTVDILRKNLSLPFTQSRDAFKIFSEYKRLERNLTFYEKSPGAGVGKLGLENHYTTIRAKMADLADEWETKNLNNYLKNNPNHPFSKSLRAAGITGDPLFDDVVKNYRAFGVNGSGGAGSSFSAGRILGGAAGIIGAGALAYDGIQQHEKAEQIRSKEGTGNENLAEVYDAKGDMRYGQAAVSGVEGLAILGKASKLIKVGGIAGFILIPVSIAAENAFQSAERAYSNHKDYFEKYKNNPEELVKMVTLTQDEKSFGDAVRNIGEIFYDETGAMNPEQIRQEMWCGYAMLQAEKLGIPADAQNAFGTKFFELMANKTKQNKNPWKSYSQSFSEAEKTITETLDCFSQIEASDTKQIPPSYFYQQKFSERKNAETAKEKDYKENFETMTGIDQQFLQVAKEIFHWDGGENNAFNKENLHEFFSEEKAATYGFYWSKDDLKWNIHDAVLWDETLDNESYHEQLRSIIEFVMRRKKDVYYSEHESFVDGFRFEETMMRKISEQNAMDVSAVFAKKYLETQGFLERTKNAESPFHAGLLAIAMWNGKTDGDFSLNGMKEFFKKPLLLLKPEYGFFWNEDTQAWETATEKMSENNNPDAQTFENMLLRIDSGTGVFHNNKIEMAQVLFSAGKTLKSS